MENKSIIYDKVFEIVNVASQTEANEYLQEFETIDENTCLIWDFLSFNCVYDEEREITELHYILGHKYIHLKHNNK